MASFPLRLLPLLLLALSGRAPDLSGKENKSDGVLPPLSEASASRIGQKIWQNECAGTNEGLTSWNSGEDFASLGIGHFIWYVKGRRGPFEESFPQLIAYLKDQRVAMPQWLANQTSCPWTSRQGFLAEQKSARMIELRKFLANTVSQQTAFIVLRLEASLPAMIRVTPEAASQSRLQGCFRAVGESPQGVYALIDYVNFKGEGTKKEERYRGQGWGLRDVLLEMRGQPRGAAAANEFGEAAKRVLSRRVANSPPERGEQRWLPGWHNRCDTYRRPL
ncbi:MAG: hypothetical protein WBE58_11080 [Verrucomicrobiales bacterium]